MEITGKIDQIILKNGKQHDVRFAFNMSDGDIEQLVGWRHAHLVITIEPLVEQLAFPEEEPSLGQFTVDDVIFPIQADRVSITGHEIREIADLDLVAPLWLVMVEKQPSVDADGFGEITTEYEVVEPTATIELADGMRFVSTLGETEESEAPEADDAELAAVLAADREPGWGERARGGVMAVLERPTANKCGYAVPGPECRNPAEWEWNGVRFMPVLLCDVHKALAELRGQGSFTRIAEARG